MTIQQMIAELRRKVAEQLEARTAAQANMDAVFASVEARGGDQDFTETELAAFTEARAAALAADTERGDLEARIGELEAEASARAAAADLERRFTAERTADETRRAAVDVRVGEDRTATYRNAPDAPSFFSDAFRMVKRHDFEAEARIRRHMDEMRAIGAGERPGAESAEHRAAVSSAFGGLVVPQYLVDLFAPVLRNGRATANAVRQLPLPAEGMVFNVPRGVVGASTGAQATENTAVSESAYDSNNDLTVNVRTIAGAQTVSRQSLERGTPGLDRIIFEDLVEDYAAQLNNQILNGDGTGGTHLGILALGTVGTIAYTDASPTVAEIWPKLAGADALVATNRKMAANLRIMHPNRWGWFTGAVDTTGRPVINTAPSDAYNAMGIAEAEKFGEGQLAGVLKTLPVLLDGAIPTTAGAGTEDVIVNLRRQDPILWEENGGVPHELMFEETNGNTLGVELVVYGYSAFTADRRPEAIATIEGTGLIAPTF